MTGNKKLRSLFLTALMVMSVFAMTVSLSGAAAAANSDASVQSAVEYTEDGNTVVEIVLSQDTTDISAVDIVGPDVEEDNTTVRQVGTNGFAVNLTDDVTPNEDLDVEIVDSVNGHIATAEDVTVTATSVEENGDDATVYQGEAVGIVAATPGTDFTVSGGGDTITASTGTDSKVARLPTDNLDTGQEYEVDFGGTTTNFSVSNLGLSVSTGDVEVGDDIEADVETNRQGEVNVSLMDGDTVENSTVVAADSLDTTTVNLGSLDETGSYTVNVTDLNTGISAEDSLNVSEQSDQQAEFGEGVVTEHVGDVASIPIQLESTDEATVTIGSQDDGYFAIANVTDDSGDGEVTVNFNTYTAGGSNASGTVLTVADDGDSLEVQNTSADLGTVEETQLENGNYNMNVTAGHVAQGSDDYNNPTDQGTLSLQTRSTEAVTVWTAPEGDSVENEDASFLWNNVGSSVTEAEEISDRDDVILQVEGTGLEGVLDFHDNALFTEQSNVSLEITHTNPDKNRDAQDLNLDSTSVNVISDAANDTYFVAVDTSDLSNIDTGNNYEANFSVNSDSVLASDGAENVQDTFNYREADASLDTMEVDGSDTVVVQPAENQTVTGETNIAPGSEVTVHMSSDDVETPFLVTPSATVGANGTLEATTDEFSDVGLGANFTASVRVGNNPISDDYTGRVLEEQDPGTPTDTATPTDSTPTDSTPTDSTPTEETATPTEEETATPTEETTTEGEGPGFGVAVGLIALIGAALLAARRNN